MELNKTKFFNLLEQVTDIRQDLSNNGRLAYILVSSNLQTKILHKSEYLFNYLILLRVNISFNYK